MKLKNIILYVALSFSLIGCYEDLGNYTYRDINEIAIEGLDPLYERDLDDSLKIYPKITGTLYSDTSKFTYQWKVDGRVLAESHDLEVLVDMLPGVRKIRYLIKDKATEVTKFVDFDLKVSSSTAGDLFMILSKSNGKAEMSYLRLDKEDANFAVNYFESRFERPLGVEPKKIDIIYMQYGSATSTTSPYIYPFGKNYGGVMVLVDDKINVIDKNSLEPDAGTQFLTGESYTGVAAYPKPDTEGYKSQYVMNMNEMWRTLANGATQTGFQFYEVSNGAMYSYACAGNMISSRRLYYNVKSPYTDGYLAPFCFFDAAPPATGSYPVIYGYDLGDVLVFDIVHGRFASMSYGAMRSVATTTVPVYAGHDLFYGSHTNEKSTSVAVLTSGNTSKLLLINKSGTTYTLSKEINTTGIINKDTKFYNMKYAPYMFITSGNKIYSYSLLEALAGEPLAEKHVVARLTDYGYDTNAKITAITVSRSEGTMLLGVSRYGDDKEAMGDENKGDLLRLNLDKSSLALTFNQIYSGVAGIPVDVKIKYQQHIRDGVTSAGVVVDKF